MIRIQQIKLRPDHSEKDMQNAVSKALRIGGESFQYTIVRRSLDARKKPDLYYIYTVDVSVKNEKKILEKNRKNRSVSKVIKEKYVFPVLHERSVSTRPVIVGSGPAGMFCGLMLARAGLCPIILERGRDVQTRKRDVETFWNGGPLNEASNVQFGEGGAGTFSDGKLNTAIKDPSGRIRFVLETFVQAGADPQILYDYKPHVGTDILENIVQAIREEIISLGGEYRFSHQLIDIEKAEDGYDLHVQSEDGINHLRSEVVVLALGHSARDTFRMLQKREFPIRPKPFAMGVRVQHPQKKIDEALYGENCPYEMPPAAYKLTHKMTDGRGVYSFCMCPGGYVVNASSEKGRLAVNGMSYSDRGSENANSAIVVTVPVEAFPGTDALDGMRLQQQLEEAAYQAGRGSIPVQRFEDFEKDAVSKALGSVNPMIKGQFVLGDVRNIFPEYIQEAVIEGMHAFSRQITGFDDPDTLLCGIESRTSSPIRLQREETMETEGFPGIYPCGEGAGYAGGITSAAVDGIKTAEAIVRRMASQETE